MRNTVSLILGALDFIIIHFLLKRLENYHFQMVIKWKWLIVCHVLFRFKYYYYYYFGQVENKMEKAMAPHSSTLAWRVPWTEEPGGLQSMGSRRVGHNWVTSLSLFTFMHWRRKWQPTPVFLPGESQGRGSLVGCRLWGCTELDTTEVTYQQQRIKEISRAN